MTDSEFKRLLEMFEEIRKLKEFTKADLAKDEGR